MRILITGNLGFIGSHLASRLLKEGHEVFGVDDASGGNNTSSGLIQYYIDCRDVTAVNKMMEFVKPEVIYACAAQAAEGKSHFSPIDITTRCYNTSLNTLVAGINNGMKRFVFISSVAVYGSAKPPFSEDTKPEPEDVYGLSKLNIEETLRILSKVHNFEWTIARAHNVYGPRQSMTDPYRNVVALWMNKVLKGEPYVIYGNGSMKRCYTYIDDLVEGLYKMGFGDVNKEIFNLGADEAVSLKELSDAIQKVTGGVVPPTFLPMRVQEVETAVLLHDKAKKILKYETKTNLLEGIKRTWAWAKDQGPQELKYTDFEIDSPKIPANWRV